MIVVVTSADDATADYLCKRLAAGPHEHVRINTEHAATETQVSLSPSGSLILQANGVAVEPEQVTGIWLRRPRPIRFAAPDPAEAAHAAREWSEALEGFLAHVPLTSWVNHPSVNSAASRKLEQLTRARQHSLRIPSTIVTQDPDIAISFLQRHGRVIVKPLSFGYVERDTPTGDSIVFTHSISTADILKHGSEIRACPVLLQEEIDKSADVRVNYIDGRTHATRLTRADSSSRQIVDIRRDNMNGVSYDTIPLPTGVGTAIHALMTSYGLRFAALDFAIDDEGNWIFFEVNPNGQWAWLDLTGATDIGGDLIWALAKHRTN